MKYDFRRLSYFDHGNWFQFPMDFLYFLSDKEAVVLAVVINLLFLRIEDATEDGWFPITIRDIQTRMRDYYSEFKIQRALGSLYGRCILETRQRGGRENWMYINYDALERMLPRGRNFATRGVANASGWDISKALRGVAEVPPLRLQNCDPPGHSRDESQRSSNALRTYRRTIDICREPGVLIWKRENPIWEEMATNLRAAIEKTHKVPKSQTPKKWAPYFKKLLTLDGISEVQIKKVLQWYCQALPERDPYLPIAESGRIFRDKFGRIENAMKRTQQISGTVEHEDTEATTTKRKSRQIIDEDDTTPLNIRGW